MQGPRELKRHVVKYAARLKACHYDSLVIFKLERCKKWRKVHRRPRDGSIHDDLKFWEDDVYDSHVEDPDLELEDLKRECNLISQ